MVTQLSASDKILAFPHQCHLNGLRVTRQRMLIYKSLVMDPSHPNAEEMHQHVLPSMPNIALSTVYNVLEQLTEHHLIRKVSTQNHYARYDANTSRHHHLICNLCNAITDISIDEPLSFPSLIQKAADFQLNRTEIHFYGTCADCQTADGISN